MENGLSNSLSSARDPCDCLGWGGGGRGAGGHLTLNTLIWQLAECKCSEYSPFSLCLKVSICTRKGTPFSPPCFLGVNSVWPHPRGSSRISS